MIEKNILKISYLKTTSLLILLCILVFTSCDDEQNENPELEFTYLVDYEKLHTLQKNIIIVTQSAVALQYPEINLLKDSTNYSVDVYRLTYRTHYKDQEIIASGLACIPASEGIFPILSFQNGTNSAHANAPTENASNSMFTILQGLAGNGYILLIPDYIGFGASDTIVHPYYIKDPTNNAIIDLIIATREFIDNFIVDAVYSQDCYLAGYSQGGWASLSALQTIEHDELLDIQVKATSCGAGAYDLISATEYILALDTFPGPQYLPYYLYSHQQYGLITDPMNKYFQEPYASIIPDLFNGSLTNAQVNAQLTDTISNLLNADFITNFKVDNAYEEIRTDMVNNSVSAWPAASLLRFYHGTADLHVSPSQSKNIYQDFQSVGLGDRAEYFDIPNVDHNGGVLPWGISTLVWFNELKYSYHD
jgi:pimeloyl-ACP methyl ester carboxylesterase